MAELRKILDDGGRADLGDDAALTAEELRDLAAAGDDEFFPFDMVKRLLGGEHPVRVFRTHRKLTRKQLAAQVGISAIRLCRIERGQRAGSARLLDALARTLKVDADLLAVE